MESFHSIYSHGFIRVAVCVPAVRVANPHENVRHTLELAGRASDLDAAVAVFPEMGLSAYSNEDLFHQDALLDATVEAVSEIVEASRRLRPILLIGAPLRFEHKLFNCAVAIYRGKILGITPKTYLPNYREFYEKRQFTSGRDTMSREVSLLGERAPFGNDVLYASRASSCMSRFARIFGRRFRRAPMPRWQGRRS